VAPIDFFQDLKFALHIEFADYVKIPMQKSVQLMLLDHLTVHKKLISVKPRKIQISPTLLPQLQSHIKKNEIKHIIESASQGGNLNFYQSKKLFQPGFHDHLLYEWNIYHFHLSLEKDKKDKKGFFVKQTDALLFAYITESDAIFLDTASHSEGIFADVKWLEILHDHFPDSISSFQFHKYNAEKRSNFLVDEFNPKDRQQLWNKGYSVGLTKVRDTIYSSPGIGRMTSGHSAIVVKNAGAILRWVYEITEQFKKYAESLNKHLGVEPSAAKYRLRFGESTLEIIEDSSKQIILTYPEILRTDIFEKAEL